MADITFEELLEAIRKLTPDKQEIVSQVMAEMSVAPQGAEQSIKTRPSLRNAYKRPHSEPLTPEQLENDIRAIRSEWEAELDEFYGDRDAN